MSILRKIILWGMILVVGIGVVGCTSTTESLEETQVREVETDLGIEVEGDVVALGTQQINIDFKAEVNEINIQEGEIANKGDNLIALDTSEYKNDILIKQKEIENYKLEYAQMEKKLSSNGVKIANKQDEIDKLQNELARGDNEEIQLLQLNIETIDKKISSLNDKYKNYEELLKVGGIAEKELSDVQEEIDSLKSEKESKLIEIEKKQKDKKNQIESLGNEIEELRSDMNQQDIEVSNELEKLNVNLEIAQIELDTMQSKLKSSNIAKDNIVASKDNLLVNSINCQVGGSAQGNIIELVDMNSLIVRIQIPIEEMENVKIGDKVEVEVYSNQSVVIEGEVTCIKQKAVEVNGETVILADVKINSGYELLKPGLHIDAVIYSN